MKLSFTSLLLPKEIFQTLISLFSAIIHFICLIIVNDENWAPAATPKCLTLNLPHPSFSQGFNFGPSTIIDDTAVP